MEQDLLKEAIRLSQSGQKEQARSLLSKLVQSNPANEVAWLWLIDACDSDAERKAILNWGLKQNPQSKMLSQAMQRLNVAQQPVVRDEKNIENTKSTLKDDEYPSADLEWLRSEDLSTTEGEEVTAEDLADIETISDEEFSRLSQQFFATSSSESETKQVFEKPVIEKKEKRSLFDFVNREAEADPETLSSNSREEMEMLSKITDIELDDSIEAISEPTAIEEKLKDAFQQAEPVEKRRRFFLKSFPKALKRVLFYLGISLLLVVLVLVGLFIVEQYFSTSTLWQQLFSK